MAKLLWGKVFYQDSFAGVLQEEPGDRISFTYDKSYLSANQPAIAHTLPLRSEAFISQNGLPPFFDNLVSEGWLEEAQARLLGKRDASRFELLLAFGFDCAGAVSILDPEPSKLNEALLDPKDPKEVAVMASRASLSGVQPKLALVEKQGLLYPAQHGEISTHIAKFPSRNHSDLVINEYLSTLAFQALLPEDKVVKVWIGEIQGFSEPALIIQRFDREGQRRIHFEEFNQLLGHHARAKYDGAYKDMFDFIYQTKGCLPAENYRLFLRVLAGLLLGNTDMHFKNFSMLHTPLGLRLAPAYDEVAAALYHYKTLALAIANSRDLLLGNLKPAHIVKLGEECRLNQTAIKMAVGHLAKNLENAKQVIREADIEHITFKNQLITFMEKRWNQIFTLIGQNLLKKR